MAVLKQALGVPENPDAYNLLLQELQKLQSQEDQPAKPMFTPEEQRQRVRQSNDALALGLAGSMSPDSAIQGVNSRVLTRTLADRDEKETARGTFDPLTGETRESPEYRKQVQEQRRAKVLQQALNFEDQRQRAAERAAAAEERRAWQEGQNEQNRVLRQTLAANKGGVDAEMTDLKKGLVRAQISAAESLAEGRRTKLDQVVEKNKQMQNSMLEKTDIIIKNIDTAEKQTGKMNTGIVGAVVGKVPGTGAYDLRRTIDTVKANIGFQELNAMRQMSPTGGALGQVAVKELDYLQATLGSLDANQGEKQLKENLAAVKKHYTNWRNTILRAQAEAEASSGGGSSAGAGRGMAGTPGAAGADAPPPGMDPRTWRHMTPEEKALFR